MSKNRYEPIAPDFNKLAESDEYTAVFNDCLHYVHNELDTKTLVGATKNWIKNNTEWDVTVFNSVSDPYLCSIGKFCYMMNMGGTLSETHYESFFRTMEELRDKAIAANDAKKGEVEEVPVSNKLGVIDHLRNRVTEVCEVLEKKADMYLDGYEDAIEVDFMAFFKDTDLKSQHYAQVSSVYKEEIGYLVADLENSGEDRPRVEAVIEYYEKMIDAAESMKTSTAVTRTKRPIDRVKRTSKLKYMENDAENNINSESPALIIGKTKMWVYNTKTRKLGMYVSMDSTGFDVTGSVLKNFSSESVEKTIRKASGVDLKKFVGYTEKTRDTKFEQIQSMDTKLNGKFNESIVILKIER